VRDGLVALSHFFVGDGSFQETLQRVAELARISLGADMTGVTMLVEGRARTSVFTDPMAPQIDEAQYGSGRGPCLQAFRDGQVNRIASTPVDERWPEFAEAAQFAGILSTMSLPMLVKDEPVGALNCYARRIDAFDSDALVTLGSMFASQAAIVIGNAQAYWEARELSMHLDEAMASRAVIEQAKGILMAPGGRNAEEAFGILVRASQRQNRKLREVASELVRQTEERGRRIRQS